MTTTTTTTISTRIKGKLKPTTTIAATDRLRMTGTSTYSTYIAQAIAESNSGTNASQPQTSTSSAITTAIRKVLQTRCCYRCCNGSDSIEIETGEPCKLCSCETLHDAAKCASGPPFPRTSVRSSANPNFEASPPLIGSVYPDR